MHYNYTLYTLQSLNDKPSGQNRRKSSSVLKDKHCIKSRDDALISILAWRNEFLVPRHSKHPTSPSARVLEEKNP